MNEAKSSPGTGHGFRSAIKVAGQFIKTEHGQQHMNEHTVSDSVMASAAGGLNSDPLWTPEQVAERLHVSPDWVRDHSSRKEPRLPVIRLGGGPGRAGLLRYRASKIEEFIEEMERRSSRHSRRI